MNIQCWLPLELMVWSLCTPRDSQVFSSTTVQKHQCFGSQPSLWSSSHVHLWLLEKRNFDYMGLCWQSHFSYKEKASLISQLQAQSAVILEPKRIKSVTVSIVPPSICHEVMGLDAMILVFWMLSFKPVFSLSSSTFIKRLFSSSLNSAVRVMPSAYVRYWYFFQKSWFQLGLHPVQHFAWCTLHIS